MAISVGALRTPSMQARHTKLGSFHPDNACELCRKTISGSGVDVRLDHEQYEFVTEAEAAERGYAVSLFKVGADCAKRIERALKAAS